MSRWLMAVIVTWFAAIAAGFCALEKYSFTAGTSGNAERDWPAASRLKRDPGRPTLVMFVHPNCACSRASFAELSRILVHQHAVTIHVVFSIPQGLAWEDSDLRSMARAIPGVIVHTDHDQVEATRFAAETSGQVYLFDPAGQLVFQGGITGSRGHEGDNPGAAAVRAYLVNTKPSIGRAPVFGCPLRSPPKGCASCAD